MAVVRSPTRNAEVKNEPLEPPVGPGSTNGMLLKADSELLGTGAFNGDEKINGKA